MFLKDLFHLADRLIGLLLMEVWTLAVIGPHIGRSAVHQKPKKFHIPARVRPKKRRIFVAPFRGGAIGVRLVLEHHGQNVEGTGILCGPMERRKTIGGR